MTAKADNYTPQTRLCLVGYEPGATPCSFTLAKSNWSRIKQIMALRGNRPIRLVKRPPRTTPPPSTTAATETQATSHNADRLRRLRLMRLRRLRQQQRSRVFRTTTATTTTTTTTTAAPKTKTTTSWYDSFNDNWLTENPLDIISFDSQPTQDYPFELTID